MKTSLDGIYEKIKMNMDRNIHEDLKLRVTIGPAKRGWKEMFKQIIEWGTKAAEFSFGMTSIMYGIWFLLPFPTFSVPAYHYMADMASENAWGAALILAGMCQVYGTLSNNVFSLFIRKIACLIMMWLFSTIAFSAILYNWYITGVISFGSVMVFEVLIFLKLVSKREN